VRAAEPAPAAPPPTSPPAADASPGPTAPAAAVRPVDRDSLTEAWGDTILKGLPARAKALYSAGRFVSVDADGGAHFALPNAAHRDRCVETTATVEARLSEHFGTPVRLVLEVDDDAPPAPGGGAGRAGAGSGGGGSGPGPNADPSGAPAASGASDSGSGARDYEPEDDYDPSAFSAPAPDPGDQAKEAEARLLQAFPGASEVAG
jgi:hypothetical protein